MDEDPPRQRRNTLRIGSGEHKATERHDKTVPRFIIDPTQTGITARPARNLFPTRTFSAQEVLVQTGADLPLYIIQDGVVRVTGQSIDRVAVEMPQLYPKDVIGGETLKVGNPPRSSFTYAAMDMVTVYVVDRTMLPHLSSEQRAFFDACIGQTYDTHIMSEQELVERVVETKIHAESLVEKNEELLVKQTVLEAENAGLKRRLADLETKMDEHALRIAATETRQKATDDENRRLKVRLAEQGTKQKELDQMIKNLGELLIGGDTLAEAMVNLGGMKGAMGLRAQNLLHTLRAHAGAVRPIPIEEIKTGLDRLPD